MGLGRELEQEQEAGLAVASVLWRSEAGLGGRQNRVRWQIGRLNALEVGLGEWWKRVMASQELGRWVWMEIQVWMTSCCTPEAWKCTGYFRKLNTRHVNGQTKDKTGQKGGSDGRKERRPEGSSHHAHRRERQQVRKERRKEGGRTKEKGADEAGKTAQSFTKVFFQVLCIFVD